jgi:2,3-diketo-5-methylthiopentyl-1-phosphate enolase
VFYELAAAGVHMIKDDELIADPCHAYLEDRVEVCRKAAERALRDTGNKAIYLANITDRPDRMLEKAHRLIAAGVTGLMVNALATGYGALEMITADPKVNVPVLAHPCFAGAYYESPISGLSSHLVVGKLLRLAGADVVVYMSPYGKLEATREKYIRTAIALRAPFYHLKPTAPLPAAGMNPGMIWKTYAALGGDWVIGAGGAMHGHPGGVKAGVAALKQAADAARLGIGPAEAAAQHPELAEALAVWPIEAEAGALFELQR